MLKRKTMRTINSYITRNMLISCGMALCILVFVLLSGYFYQAFELLSRGVPILQLCRIILLLLPDVLCVVLPLSLLVSTVLVFSRMSADSEIIALKSMGVSIWQMVMPALVISFLFSGLCLWMSLWLTPACKYQSEKLRYEALAETPLSLLEPGEFSDLFPNCSLRIGKKVGRELKDVHLVISEKESNRCQDIYAKTGVIDVDMDEECFNIKLFDVNITDFLSNGAPKPKDTRFLAAHSITLPVSFASKSHNAWSILRKSKYLNLKELCAKVGQYRMMSYNPSAIILELHERFSLGLSPFAFMLLGLPFGIRSRRSELSIGLLICVLLALGFYAFALLAKALRDVSGLHPEFIIWIPNIVYQVAGLYMLKRLEKQG